MKKISILSLIAVTSITAFTTLFTTSCKKEVIVDRIRTDTVNHTDTIVKTDTVLTGPGVMNFKFDNMVGSQDFDLSSTFTINGNPFKFDHIRYWISNVSLIKEDGTLLAIPKSYYLMEECGAISVQDGDYTYPANKRETVRLTSIPEGVFKGIVFNVGVDSIHNNNLSLQAGELSQLSGMTNISWMWHTSYIFSAVKGTFNGGDFKAEVGTNIAYRNVTLNFPSNIEVKPTGENNIHIKVDVGGVFGNVDLATTPVIGANTLTEMTQVADNYKNNVFSVISAE